jgi:hypothetical protein
METDAHEWESDLTEVMIGAGFLERVYERALIHELAVSVTKSSTSASMSPISWSAKSLSSRLSLALLINFQRPKVEWKRVLLDR